MVGAVLFLQKSPSIFLCEPRCFKQIILILIMLYLVCDYGGVLLVGREGGYWVGWNNDNDSWESNFGFLMIISIKTAWCVLEGIWSQFSGETIFGFLAFHPVMVLIYHMSYFKMNGSYLSIKWRRNYLLFSFERHGRLFRARPRFNIQLNYY